MKKNLSFILLLLVSSQLYSQISFNALLDSFSGFENNSFKSYLEENDFVLLKSSQKGDADTWVYGYNEKSKKAEIILKTRTSPEKSLWIESYGHPVYVNLENDIRRNCESRGMYGCMEVEYWESFEHLSGIKFKLIQYPDSEETGQFIIEVLE